MTSGRFRNKTIDYILKLDKYNFMWPSFCQKSAFDIYKQFDLNKSMSVACLFYATCTLCLTCICKYFFQRSSCVSSISCCGSRLRYVDNENVCLESFANRKPNVKSCISKWHLTGTSTFAYEDKITKTAM
jgi:hypothetical protein